MNAYSTVDAYPIRFWQQACLLMALSVLCRWAFLGLTTYVFGDAVNYSVIAEKIARGHFDQIDPFWVNLFCYWEALFYLIGASNTDAVILSTFIPGVLLTLPVLWMANTLYNPSVGWLAGIFCAFHPRLISYSVNGYAEMFYLLALTIGIACMTKLILDPKGVKPAWGCGVAFGVYVCTRNEGVVLFLAVLIAFIMARYMQIKGRMWKLVGIIFMGFFLVCTGYIVLCELTIQSTGLFQKSTVGFKRYSEQLDFEKSAKEIYQTKTIKQLETPSIQESLILLVQRYLRNVLYTLERFPGVLLSPLLIFALILPVFGRTSPPQGSQFPLVVMMVFPLLFYPLIQVEPRYLFATLIPINIYGSAGLHALYRCLFTRIGSPRAIPIWYSIIALIILLNVGVSIWLGRNLEREHRIHQDLANWIQSHTDPNEIIAGDGYGYINTTAFLAHREPMQRIWSDIPADITEDLKIKGVRWLVLYEPFIEKGNSALLPVLNTGIPGTKKMFETQDKNGKRYQIYYVYPTVSGPAMP